MQPVAPAPVGPLPRRCGWSLGVIAVFAVLAGGGVLARMWVLQQYYVGANDDHVAIFQGVRGSVVGLPLQHLVEQTDIALTDLPEATRNTVRDGILVTEGGLAGARRRKVALLRGSMLAPCHRAGGRWRRPRRRSRRRRQPQLVPRRTRAAVRRRPGPGRSPPTRTTAPARRPTVDTTPLPTVAPEPGLNCRPVS